MDPVGERYDLVRSLGEGASGEAWMARQRDTGQAVVVKLLHKKHARSARHYERFRREVLALAKLQHPHVVQLLDCGRCERRGQPYFVMAFAEGRSLEQVLRAEQRLAPRRALRLADQVLQALEFAHAQGILHRDLKPDNLLLERPGPDERVRVLDFGLAKHLKGGAQTQGALTQGVVGTPLYLAPEQCRAVEVTPATDIYAVGCILTRLLTGRTPFRGELLSVLKDHIQSPAPRLRQLDPDGPAALEPIVAACLEKEPAARPTASTLRRMLQDAASALPGRDEDAAAAGTTLEDGAVIPLPPPPARPTGRGGAAPSAQDARASSSEPTLRLRMDVGSAGAHVLLFRGGRLRFGQDPGSNDLVVRAYPRWREPVAATADRTRRLGGRHGELLVSERGAWLADLGSGAATVLDDARLAPRVAYPLPPAFRLRLAESVEFAGSVVPDARGARCVRLRRVDEAPHVMYVLVNGPATIGAAETDAVSLALPGILPGHAVLDVSGAHLLIGPGRPDAVVVVGGRRLAPGRPAPIPPNARVELGSIGLRFAPASDEDMRP